MGRKQKIIPHILGTNAAGIDKIYLDHLNT